MTCTCFHGAVRTIETVKKKKCSIYPEKFGRVTENELPKYRIDIKPHFECS